MASQKAESKTASAIDALSELHMNVGNDTADKQFRAHDNIQMNSLRGWNNE